MAKPVTKQEPVLWTFILKHGDRWPAENFEVVDDAGNPQTGFTVAMRVVDGTTGVTLKDLSNGTGEFVISAGSTGAQNKVTFNTTVDIRVTPNASVPDRGDIQITLSNGHIHTQYDCPVIVTKDYTP